jgi:ribosomal protein S18 acetylase RimI-like enzyme
MKIRKAGREDIKELFRLKLLSKKEELKYSSTLKPMSKSKGIYMRYCEADLEKSNRAFFIAVEGNDVVGVVFGQLFKPLKISNYGMKGYISNLYVVKKYRGKGIGKKLVLRMIKWLKDNNVGHISLEIHIDNKGAQSLYRRLGFEDYTIKMGKNV